MLGLKNRKPCPFDVTAGHSGDENGSGNVDSREKNFHENGGKCSSGRFYGASCGRSPNGGLVWPTPEVRDRDGQRGDSTIGEVVKLQIEQAEKDAPEECADEEKCCSKIILKVTCLDDPRPARGIGPMANAIKNDPLAKRVCKYSNTYKCPNSKGQGGGWKKPLFK